MLKLGAGEYLGRDLRRRDVRGLSLAVTAYPPRRDYPWHVHECATLFVLLAARHRDETPRASFDQPPLSAVFHPTTGPHATSTGPDGLVGINLELTPAWLDRCQLRERDLGGECRLLDSVAARLLGLRLAASAGAAGEAADADAETAALELLGCLAGDRPPRTPPWLSRACDFLAAAAHTPVGLRDVAAEVGVHPVYCARAFRRATGRTVSAHLQALRLLEAGRRVLDEGRPLAEAAAAAGFADQAHLTRTCSRTLGFTPGRLRPLRGLLAGRAGSTRSRTDP